LGFVILRLSQMLLGSCKNHRLLLLCEFESRDEIYIQVSKFYP
jgi:hypothetical protein